VSLGKLDFLAYRSRMGEAVSISKQKTALVLMAAHRPWFPAPWLNTRVAPVRRRAI